MLSDVKHVEAYAIVKRLLEDPGNFEGRNAAEVFLAENKPPASAYTAAMRSLSEPEGMGV